jgi:putative aldouronate transport system substrate-binding protein
MLTGCGGKKENTAVQNSDTNSNVPEYLNLTGMPIVKKPITLKAFVTGSASMVDFNEMLIWQEYEKLTGIKIEWNVVTQGAAEKRNLLLASNDLPDMFFKGSIPVLDIISYGEQGTFIKLNPLTPKLSSSQAISPPQRLHAI